MKSYHALLFAALTLLTALYPNLLDAQELPQGPPVDERFNDLESLTREHAKQLQEHENRLRALERPDMCKCALTGECTCPANDCDCEWCIQHLTAEKAVGIYVANEKEISEIWQSLPEECTMKDAVQEWLKRKLPKNASARAANEVNWLGRPNDRGRSAEIDSAPDCINCVKLENGLVGFAEHIKVNMYASMEEGPHQAWPYVRLLENGEIVECLHASVCSQARIEDWLNGSQPLSARPQMQSQFAYPSRNTFYTRPLYSSAPAFQYSSPMYSQGYSPSVMNYGTQGYSSACPSCSRR
jgi:hypothetical protein